MRTEDIDSEVVHICMISDDNYIVPTCVAIQSFVSERKYGNYCIHIITSELSERSEGLFKQFENDNIKIDIHHEDASYRFRDMHVFDSNAICVASIAALLKFVIPELFPDIDKMLYLDGDLVVKIDLHELYNININDYYAAAVIDSGSIYYKHTYVNMVDRYFNSGVLLLNLKKLRNEHISECLIETKRNLNDSSLMDQNVFNLVFDRNVYFLPIRYNFMPVSLEHAYSKWSIQQINELYGTCYENKKQLFSDAAIIHYSSKDKPWKSLKGACSSEWISYYLRAPIEHSLLRLPERKEPVGISVIMPCYNSESYIRQTLDSILSQTFQDFEILCLDDGSTDDTLAILKEYESKYQCIRVFANKNFRQGYERNMGIRNSKGKYLYYMDSDDLLDPNCFNIIYKCAEENQLDLLYFEGESFYDSPELEEKHPNYKTLYNRKDAFPRVYDGNELYIKFRKAGALIISPCLQLARRDFIVNNYLYFPEMRMMEDNLYTFWSIIRANRIKCLGDVLFFRRVRINSTMTSSRTYEKIESIQIIIREMVKALLKYDNDSPMYAMIKNHIRSFYNNLLFECNNMKIDYKNLFENHLQLALLVFYMDEIKNK